MLPARRVVGGLVSIVVVAVGAAATGQETLESRVEGILKTSPYRTGKWGLLVVDRKTGEAVFERNSEQLFRPASVTKLFSSAAALAELGADHRFQTTVKRRGEVGEGGALQGDLILVASGDPSLGGRTGPDGQMLFTDSDHSYAGGHDKSKLVSNDPQAPVSGLDALAREIADSGVKSITGDVLVDDRLFEAAESTGSGPRRVSPIVINDNVVDLLVAPGARAGDPATVTILPATAYVNVDARVETTAEESPARIQVEPIDDRSLQVRGTIPLKHEPIVKIFEVQHPANFARALFVESLRRRGVAVQASPFLPNRTDRLPSRGEVAALPKVAEYTSPPFREYLRVLLKVSQNLHASTLPLLLAAKSNQTTLDAGLRRQGEILKSLGLEPGTHSFGGGAGGSTSDLVTPKAAVTLLRAMAARPDFAVYESALPVLGRDGTLAKSVAPESPARGHVRAKTGTYWVENGLDGKAILTSKALAGYMETASGRPLVFAFFVNDVPLDAPAGDVSAATDAAGRLLGTLCEAFYTDKPTTVAAPAPAANPTAATP